MTTGWQFATQIEGDEDEATVEAMREHQTQSAMLIANK